MTVWVDIQTALTDFWDWLKGVGGGLTDSLGELGSWIFGAIKWLADQIYNAWTYFSNWLYSGLQWLGDRLKEGYEALAQWVSGGLQWIGSGLSWIGQHLYSLGQWIWNGILWVCRTVAGVIESLVNWIWQKFVGIYNSIVEYIASWVKSINDFLNDWIERLRDKFKDFVLVNTTLPAVFKSFDKITEGDILKGILGMFVSPFAGAIAGELVDAIVPRPHSERIMFFPEFLFPTLTFEPITIEKPEAPATPASTEIPSAPMHPPSVGYRPTVEKSNIAYTLYDIIVQGIRTKDLLGKVATEYEVGLSNVFIRETTSKAVTDYYLQATSSQRVEKVNKAVTDFVIISKLGTYITKTNYAGTSYDISVSGIVGLHRYSYARTTYDAYVSPITKLSGLSEAKTEVTLLPSIGVAIVTTPSTQVVIEAYMPYELPQYQEGTGTSYEVEVVPPSSAIAYTSKVGTSYEISGNVIMALIEAIIYLGEAEYAKVETSPAFSESFTIQGVEVSLCEPETAIFEDFTIIV